MKPLSRSLLFFAVICTVLLSVGFADAGSRIYLPEKGEKATKLDYRQILKDNPAPEGVPVHSVLLKKTRSASFHLVQVNTTEVPHVHQWHEGTAMLLQGRGDLWLSGQILKLKKGDMVTIPRKAVHYFKTKSRRPAVFYVTFSPPYRGKDRLVVKSVNELLQ